jgi:hypothetical protein
VVRPTESEEHDTRRTQRGSYGMVLLFLLCVLYNSSVCTRSRAHGVLIALQPYGLRVSVIWVGIGCMIDSGMGFGGIARRF